MVLLACSRDKKLFESSNARKILAGAGPTRDFWPATTSKQRARNTGLESRRVVGEFGAVSRARRATKKNSRRDSLSGVEMRRHPRAGLKGGRVERARGAFVQVQPGKESVGEGR